MARQYFIYFLFFLSGFTSLVFELVWSRMLLRIFGTTAYGSAAITGAFMTGMAAGSFFAGKYLPGKIARDPFFYYGVLEAIIAVFGIFSVIFGIDWLPSSFFENMTGSSDPLSYLLRYIVGTIVLLFPCAAMGATYPLLCLLLGRLSDKPVFAFLYSANCFGAMIGCILSGFFLLPHFGISKTCFIAASVNLFIFVLTLAFRSRMKTPKRSSKDEISHSSILINCNMGWGIALSFFAGFLALVLELIFIRFFSTLFNSCVYSISVVLATILAALSAGAIAVRAIRLPPERILVLSCVLAAVSLLIPLYLKPFSSLIYGTIDSFLSTFYEEPFYRAVLSRALLSVIYVFPATFFTGAILPAIISLLEKRSHNKIDSLTAIYAANCAGAVCGAAAGGFLLIPLFMSTFQSGMEAVIKFVFSSNLLLAIYLIINHPPDRLSKVRDKIPLAGLFFAAGTSIWFVPSCWLPHDSNLEKIAFYKEGLNSTVTLIRSNSLNSLILKNDDKTEATLPLDFTLICPGSDLSTHILLADLPMLLHDGPAKKAMLIGLGTGTTAEAFLEHPELSKLLAAELEPAVVEACLQNSQLSRNSVFQLRINDARYLLACRKELFDVITSQPAEPWVSGSADLYTKDFFSLTKERLADGGIFCQWIQLYAIPPDVLANLIATFRSVYPNIYICHAQGAGEIILLGFKNDGRFSSSSIKKKIDAVCRKNPLSLLARAGISKPEDLLSLLKSSAGYENRASFQENTDDHPYSEYAAGRAILSNVSNLKKNQKTILNQQNIALETLDRDWQDTPLGARQLARWARALSASQEGEETKSRALNLAKQAAAKLPCPETLWCKALVETENGDKNAAAGDRKEALAHKNKTEADAVSLLDINLLAGHLSAAENLYAEAIVKYPFHKPLIERGAWLALAQNKPQLAQERFNLAAASNQLSLTNYLGQCYAALHLGKTEKAETALTSYLTCNPWNGDAQLLYSLILSDKRQFKAAWAHALDCNKLHPHDYRGFLLTLDACLRSGQKSQAGTFLKTLPADIRQDRNIQKIASFGQKSNTSSLIEVGYKYPGLIEQIKDESKNAKNGIHLFGYP